MYLNIIIDDKKFGWLFEAACWYFLGNTSSQSGCLDDWQQYFENSVQNSKKVIKTF